MSQNSQGSFVWSFLDCFELMSASFLDESSIGLLGQIGWEVQLSLGQENSFSPHFEIFWVDRLALLLLPSAARFPPVLFFLSFVYVLFPLLLVSSIFGLFLISMYGFCWFSPLLFKGRPFLLHFLSCILFSPCLGVFGLLFSF